MHCNSTNLIFDHLRSLYRLSTVRRYCQFIKNVVYIHSDHVMSSCNIAWIF